MAESANWYGHSVNFCSADTEYGRAASRWVASIGLIASVRTTRPSGERQRDCARAHRRTTDRRNASFRPSR
jgi:hypothetical protein